MVRGTTSRMIFIDSSVNTHHDMREYAANAANQIPADVSTFVVVQTTAQLRIAGNRQIAIDH